MDQEFECSSCGSIIIEDAKKCPICGEKFDGEIIESFSSTLNYSNLDLYSKFLRSVLIIFSLCIPVALLYFFLNYTLNVTIKSYNTTNWTRITGSIIESKINTFRTLEKSDPGYYPSIKYCYKTEKGAFKSSVPYIGKTNFSDLDYNSTYPDLKIFIHEEYSSDKKIIEKFISALPIGMTLEIFINPAKHSESIILHNHPNILNSFFDLGGIIILFLLLLSGNACILSYGLWGKRWEKRAKYLIKIFKLDWLLKFNKKN